MTRRTTEVDPPKLLLDVMLGRLTKWLRLMGYDAEYDRNAADPELARRARSGGRVLVTRDLELSQRRGLSTLLIRSEVLEEQVGQVLAALGPSPDLRHPRCCVCNAQLRPISTAEAAGRVPPYVLRNHTEFHHCPACGRIYWPGTHLQQIQDQIDRFTTGASGDAHCGDHLVNPQSS